MAKGKQPGGRGEDHGERPEDRRRLQSEKIAAQDAGRGSEDRRHVYARFVEGQQ